MVLLFGMWLNVSYQQHRIDEKLLEADGLIWKSGEKQFEARVTQDEDGELLNIKISIVNSAAKEVYKKTEIIDRDMFGGGFVRAMQVDQDSDNEIIIWHAKAKYYLDFSEGQVREISFDRVPQEVKRLAENWHKYNVMAAMEIAIFIAFVVCYYILYVLVKGILRLFRRKDNSPESI